MRRQVTIALFLSSCAVLLASGCTPKYPKCDKDAHCKEGEFCVDGQCQQCRSNDDCRAGEECKAGRCERKAGFCESAADCPEGQGCKDNRCGPCSGDEECGPGGRCRDGRCLAAGQCMTDEDCPENYECQNGTCTAPPTDAGAAPCQPDPIYFGFDQHVLSPTASRSLQQAANCIKQVPGRSIRVEGHADPRGTEEYNLALGDRRARSVTTYLQRLGVERNRLRAVSKGKLEATGTDEESWARDRKAVFVWE